MAIQKLLALYLFVAVTKAQNDYTYTTVHVHDYIAANKIQFAASIKNYDSLLHAFEELYLGRIKTIDIQLNLLVGSLKQADEHLYTLALLSAANKECVNKYRPQLPGVAATTALVQQCSSSANLKLNSLNAAPKSTRNSLKNYYDITFEAGIQACGKKVPINSSNYTACVMGEVYKANTYTSNNQRTFDNQMDAAESSADIAVKQALDCSYQVHSDTITVIAGTNTLTDICIQGLDCTCSTGGHYCEHVQYMPSYMVDRNNPTMLNPFYHRSENLNCLMLKITSGM